MSGKTTTQNEAQREQLTRVPYVGDIRADSLVEAGFTSIRMLSDATAEELAEKVYGIGETDAQRILDGTQEVLEDEGNDATDAEVHEAVERMERNPRNRPKTGDRGVTPEVFESRLVIADDGQLWYRIPANGVDLPPYRAPGFEAWCEAKGRDPEEFRAQFEASGDFAETDVGGEQ